MRANNYMDDCEGCNLSRERKKVVGGIVRLPGKWMLNHYQQREQRFLGWLALQPELHTDEWDELDDDELKALGPNIKRVKLALREYWRKHFPTDCIKRIYVVYFFESPFDKTPGKHHLHIHLIPRFDSLTPLLKKDEDDINAWKIYSLTKDHAAEFPEEYRLAKPEDEPKIEALMEKLRSLLSHTACPNMKEEKPESRLIFTLIMCLVYGGLAALIIGFILLLDWLTL